MRKINRKYIKEVSDVAKYCECIPTEALSDVRTRLGDYALSNGSVDKGYLDIQLRYLDNIVKAVKGV